jgi:molecular chaperone DnaK
MHRRRTEGAELVIGIDLGTTNSIAAVWDRRSGRVVPLGDAEGRFLMPSMVGWDAEAENWAVGREAEMLSRRRPQAVAYSIKRYIGRSFSDVEVTSGRTEVSYELIPGNDPEGLEDVVVELVTDEHDARIRLTAPQVSAKVLAKLRENAALVIGVPEETLRHAVITVPAYFNLPQRKATIRAGHLAGFEAIEILNEPTAAALVSAQDLLGPEPKRMLIYDLGGGTFDVSLVEASRDQVGYVFDTLVLHGDTRLGGDDIDVSVAGWLASQLQQRFRLDVPSDDRTSWEALRRSAEHAKVRLSTRESYTVDLAGLTQSAALSDAQIELDRSQLDACAAGVLQRTERIVRTAVEEIAELTWDEVDEVILVGGQTLMPAVQRSVEKVTGRKPRVSDQPQLAVALGAAEYAHTLSLGGKRFQERTLINALALALGIQLDDNTFKPLVEANRTLPTRSVPFSVTTIEDNQASIKVKVLQGPHGATRADECKLLGTLEMEVPAAPKGEPRFEVVFEVHDDATMTVILNDTGRDRSEKREIAGSRRMLAWRPDQVRE